MSSEKFELAQDELESLLERLQGEVASLTSAQGEARKRAIQVQINIMSHWAELTADACTFKGWLRAIR